MPAAPPETAGQRRSARQLPQAVRRQRVQHRVVLADRQRAADVDVGVPRGEVGEQPRQVVADVPPWPKNTGTMRTARQPNATSASVAPARSGVMKSRNASATGVPGTSAATRACRRCRGSASGVARAA